MNGDDDSERTSETRTEGTSERALPTLLHASPSTLHASTSALLRKLCHIEKVAQEPDVTMAQLKHAVGQLVTQLRGVMHFVEERAVLEDQLATMQERMKEVVAEEESKVKETRMEMLEDRVKLRSVEAALHQTHEQDVLQRATELLDRRTKEINEQNFDLVKDKLLLTRDVEAARERGAVLEQRHDKWRREAELAATAESELVARSVRQKREIAALKRQVKTLEDGALQVAQSYEARLAAQQRAHEAVVLKVEKERDAARASAQAVQRDLVKVRSLAGQLVQQRGDLESFFYAALSEVRQEVLQERRRAIVAGPTLAETESTLRLETQPRLMLTDKTAAVPRRQWTIDKKGFPALRAVPGRPFKALPPIPHPSTDTGADAQQGLHAEPPKLRPDSQHSATSGDGRVGSSSTSPRYVCEDGDLGMCLTHSSVEYYEESERQPRSLHSTTARPTLKELQQIDVAQLSWEDKERVLCYLFQRLRQRARRPRDERRTGRSPEQVEDDACDDCYTFLTQNGL